jgi:anti-sigma B factor antagonist
VSELSVSTWHGSGFAVLYLAGDLDLATASELRDAFIELAQAPERLVVVDCAGVTFMDSTAIGLMIGLRGRCEEAGCQLLIGNVSRAVGRALTLTRADDVLDVHWRDDETPQHWETADQILDALRP